MNTAMFSTFLLSLALIFIPLYPKFPLVGVAGSFVSIRFDDFLVLGLVAFFGARYLRDLLKTAALPLPRAMLLFLGIGLAGVFSGVFLTKTASLNLSLLHYFRRVEYMSLFFVGYLGLKKISSLGFLAKAMLLVSLLVALYGLGQVFFGFPVISTTNSEFSKGLALSLGPGARINSTFAGHYDLAAFCIFPLCLVIALLPISKHKWFLLAIGALVYWVLLLSASRIAFASFFGSAALLILLLKKPVWLVPLILVGLIGFFASPQLRGRYLELITNHFRISMVDSVSAQEESKEARETPDALKPAAVPEDRSFNIRLQAEWPRALRSVIQNPIFGTGYSSVGLAVDNDYLRTSAEAGIFGLAAFILIFLRFFKLSLPHIMHLSPDLASHFILAVSCALLGLLSSAVFIDIFAASKIALFAWLLMGITAKTIALYETR